MKTTTHVSALGSPHPLLPHTGELTREHSLGGHLDCSSVRDLESGTLARAVPTTLTHDVSEHGVTAQAVRFSSDFLHSKK